MIVVCCMGGSKGIRGARMTAGAGMKLETVYGLGVSVRLVVCRVGLVQIYTTDIQVIEMAATLLI